MSDQSELTARALTAKQRKAVAALLDPQNGTLEAAAAASGTPPATLRRWRKLPHFAAAIADAVGELRGDIVRRLHVAAVHAVAVLQDGLSGNATRIQLRSAELVLRHTLGEPVAVEGSAASYWLESPMPETDQAAWRAKYFPALPDAVEQPGSNGGVLDEHWTSNGTKH